VISSFSSLLNTGSSGGRQNGAARFHGMVGYEKPFLPLG
jgi:hypothetical protein